MPPNSLAVRKAPASYAKLRGFNEFAKHPELHPVLPIFAKFCRLPSSSYLLYRDLPILLSFIEFTLPRSCDTLASHTDSLLAY